MIPEALRERAIRWKNEDPDPETRAELDGLLEKNDDASARDLEDRFAMNLEFGTAGLRGVIGAGPNRMNRAVVLRTTAGFADALLAAIPDAKERGVTIGRDGRRLSNEFAKDAAGVLTAKGIKCQWFESVEPTPLTAFAVTHFGAAGGVMVTASHNPPEYNGYKVYWENGAQIIPPMDTDIAKRIDTQPAAKDVATKETSTLSALKIERAYLDAVRGLSVDREGRGRKDLRIVYTAMHGVGNALVVRAMKEAGFSNVRSVPEQAEPDGRFPTVAFPNPEEKGAMDLSFALAKKENAELILANDPDADRLAVAVPYAQSPTGYLQLTGNQVGVILGHFLLTRGASAGKPKRAAIASIVSSPLLGKIARSLGVHYEDTLTGFKWIATRAIELKKTQGVEFVFGYEEALGYTVGEVVRDKDGISGAMIFAEMTSLLATEGVTLLQQLETIHREHGLYVSSQITMTRKGASGAAEIRATMDRLRTAKIEKIGDLRVESTSDFQAGARGLPKTNMVAFELDGGSRIIARPSGTEPKAKFYFDVCELIEKGEPFGNAEKRAQAKMQSLAKAFEAAHLG